MQLTIENLSKTYSNGLKAIDDLSLQIGTGMFGLLGPNGAGKSSLMRTIATLQLADSGNIYFNDIDVLKNPMQLRKILGYLPQSFGVYPKKSATELLDYFAVLKGVASKKDRKMLVEKVLELTNLTVSGKKAVSTYSGGMKQRFGIAQLLLNNPKLIIVDEPTAGLDPAERNRFLNVLRAVGTSNTVIFSTHIVEDVKELCTDMAIMAHGKIQCHTKPSAATDELKGKVWLKNTTVEELKAYETHQGFLSSGYNEDHSSYIRVLSETKPGDGFIAAEPNLEDVYFHQLKPVSHTDKSSGNS